MSATNSRIATLRRALRILEDEYEAHKANWTAHEVINIERATESVTRLITAEKLRRVA